MKYYTTDSVLKNYSWEQTMASIWQRYPNPFSKHVLSEDTLERRVLTEEKDETPRKKSTKLFTKRLLIKTNPLPKWGQRFVNLRQVAVLEESILDRERKTLTTYTRNIGYTHTMNVIEKCFYSAPSSTDESIPATLIKREAWISSQLRGFASVLQRFGLERYKHNSQQATKGLNHVLARLFPNSTPSTQIHHQHHLSIDEAKSKLVSMTDRVVHQLENATAKAKANADSSGLR